MSPENRTKKEMHELAVELLHGAVDMHIHGGPDAVRRIQDMSDIALCAKQAGMKAVMFKSHLTFTTEGAYFARKSVPGIEVYGGVVLNYAVGGLNPKAVEAAIKLGAKSIWMPSKDSAWTVYKVYITKETPWLTSTTPIKKVEDGISILKGGLEGDELLPEVKEIIGMIAAADIILDTSHLSPKESLILASEAKKAGVKKIHLNHANASVTGASIEIQKEIACLGAYIGYAFVPCMPLYDRQDPGEIAKMIKAVGAEHSTIYSDFGMVTNPPPLEGMRMFIISLLSRGISEAEIRCLVSKNPSKLLGI